MQKQEVKRNEKKIFEPTAGAVHADDPAAGHGAGAAPIQSGLTQGAIFSAAANGLGTSYATGATVTMPAPCTPFGRIYLLSLPQAPSAAQSPTASIRYPALPSA